MNLVESLNYLKSRGFSVVPFMLAESFEQAEVFAENNNFPLILKIVTKKPLHKTDYGGVSQRIDDLKGLRKAWDLLSSKGAEFGSDFLGIMVQNYFKGTEVIVGIKADPVFGRVLLFGLGGVLVELFKDFSLRVCPINRSEARRMIFETKASSLLAGFRNYKPVNIDLLADFLSRASGLDVNEMDINPLTLSDNKLGVVDARVIG